MSRKFLVLSALALGLIVPASAKVYTRDEAVQTAMENSSDIKSAEEALITASSQVESGYGNAYPTIDLNANVTRIFGLDDVKLGTPMKNAASDQYNELDDKGNPKANAFDKNVLAPTVDGLINGMKSQGYRWQSSVGLTLTQVLYAAGKVGTAIDIAKAYKHLQEVNLENTKSKIRYEVDSLFNSMILLDSNITIKEEGIKQTQENLTIATQKFQSGSGKEIDVIRSQLDLDAQLSDLENTKKQRILARNALLNKMGLNWDADVEFIGDLRNPDANLPYPDTAMASVKQRRRELVMLDARALIKEKNIEIEEGGYKPTVALVGGLKYANNKNKITEWDAPKWDKLNKYVAFSVTMNLFKGMQTREAVVQAKSSLRSTQIEKENAERGFRMQIETCASTLENAQNQIEIAKRRVDLAKRGYDISEAAYQIGQETQINLLDANQKLREAKLGYMKAVLDWNNAYNALLNATGEY